MTPPQIFLVRHGETEWNSQGRFQGHLDSALTAKGRQQAHTLGERLARSQGTPTGIQMHVSPLGRARETAAILRKFADYTSVDEPRLREVSLGSWDGLSLAEIDAEWPGHLEGSTAFDWYFRSPDGETYDDAATRVRSWLHEVNGIVVAVSHGLLGRIIRGAYLGLPRDQALELPVPHETIWHLCGGEIREA